MVNNHFERKCYSAGYSTEYTGDTIRLKNGGRAFLPDVYHLLPDYTLV